MCLSLIAIPNRIHLCKDENLQRERDLRFSMASRKRRAEEIRLLSICLLVHSMQTSRTIKYFLKKNVLYAINEMMFIWETKPKVHASVDV
jgi:hypothetical protein